MIRFALRRKSDGKYLSTKFKYGGRTWVALNNPSVALFPYKSSLSNAAACTREYEDYYKKRYPGLRSVSFHSNSLHVKAAECPVEIVEYNLFLIDTKYGTLTAKDIREQV